MPLLKKFKLTNQTLLRFLLITTILFTIQNFTIPIPWYIQGDTAGTIGFIGFQILSSAFVAGLVELGVWAKNRGEKKKM